MIEGGGEHLEGTQTCFFIDFANLKTCVQNRFRVCVFRYYIIQYFLKRDIKNRVNKSRRFFQVS